MLGTVVHEIACFQRYNETVAKPEGERKPTPTPCQCLTYSDSPPLSVACERKLVCVSSLAPNLRLVRRQLVTADNYTTCLKIARDCFILAYINSIGIIITQSHTSTANSV